MISLNQGRNHFTISVFKAAMFEARTALSADVFASERAVCK